MLMRVWWIPQIPMKAFHVPVKDVEEAKFILNTLARYDAFQYENKIKGDYCNAGGLEVQSENGGEWEGEEWTDEEDRTIDDLIKLNRRIS